MSRKGSMYIAHNIQTKTDPWGTQQHRAVVLDIEATKKNSWQKEEESVQDAT